MESERLLILAMATECRNRILQWDAPNVDLPNALSPKHLNWMCDKIEEHVEDWPDTRLHRWIGFVQCAMLAHHMLDLEGARRMFDKAKVAYGKISDDMSDHLDPTSSFEFDIGGEG